jgi:hypothetical protein
MRHIVTVLTVLSVVLCCALALAFDAGPADPSAPTDPPAATSPATDPPPDVAAAAGAVVKATEALRAPEGPTPKKFLWAALIAAVANFVLSVVKLVTKMGDRGKKWLPRLTVPLGAVVGVCEYYLLGGSLFTAILYGGAPLGAIVIQELVGPIKSKQPAEATPAEATPA